MRSAGCLLALASEDHCPARGHKRVVECFLVALNNFCLWAVSEDVDRKNFIHVALEFEPRHDLGLINVHHPHAAGTLSDALGDRYAAKYSRLPDLGEPDKRQILVET